MENKPKILQTRTVAQSRLFRVEELDLRFSNGVEVQYERLSGSKRGAVLVVPLLDDNTVLLIREYAAGTDRYELGLPKGKIDGDETLLNAANREIQEEIGYAAKRLDHIHSVSIAPGYLAHVTHIILARDLYPARLDGDEPETIEVVPWSLDQLPQLLMEKDFSEARSIAALFITQEYLTRQRSDLSKP